MEFKDLEKLTVVKLRAMAAEYEDVKGASAMSKDKLIALVCEKMGIEHEVHRHVKTGVDKAVLKSKIRELKTLRAQALASGDKTAADVLRRRVHHIKRKIRKSTEIET